MTYEEIAGMIDHALLKPDLTDRDIVEGCKIAMEYRVAAVCVRPSDVILANKILKGSNVMVTTVIGFPHGTTSTLTKITEAKEAIANGAVELDVVINIGKVKSGSYDYVKEELKALVHMAHERKVTVKIILENCYLSDEEKIQACRICSEIGADFVKTSTGFGTWGAKEADLVLMRKYCDPNIKIKAAGGIKTLEQIIRMKELGCHRVGCSNTVEILNQIK